MEVTVSRALSDYEYMSFDDFEEALGDKPRNERWELIGGRVVKLMVGARWEHARIVANLAFALESAFRASGSRCQAFTETFYMKEKALDAQLLPDVMVVCDLDPGATGTNQAVVLVEVLSGGTEARDRFDKWHVYQKLPSLMHYVLVARDKAHVEVFNRVDGAWSGMQVLDGLDASLSLLAIGVEVPLAAIYRRVL